MSIKNNDVKRFERLNGVELPKNVQAEEVIIGSILANPKYIFKTDKLKARMFYETKNATIYHIIQNLLNNGIEHIDTLMIENQIISNKAFKEYFIGINDIKKYLDLLKENAVTDVESVGFFAKNIISEAYKRDSFIKLQEMSKNVISKDGDINEVNTMIQTEVVKFADEYIFDNDIKEIGEVCEDIFIEIEEDRERGGGGIAMSFQHMSKYFTLEAGEVCVIGGRAKGGKSMIFLQEAIHKARNGLKVLIWDTEMSTKLWVTRALSHLSGIPIRKVKTGEDLSLVETEILNKAKAELKTLPITHLYRPEVNVSDMWMTVKQLLISKGLDLLIIDYLKVTNTNNTTENEYNMLGNYAIEIKNLAGYFQIPILMGAQLHHKENRLGDSSKVVRYISTLCIWTAKTHEERIADGVKQGTHKMAITNNRLGMQHDEGGNEYLNFVFNPSIATIYEAEVWEHTESDNTPY